MRAIFLHCLYIGTQIKFFSHQLLCSLLSYCVNHQYHGQYPQCKQQDKEIYLKKRRIKERLYKKNWLVNIFNYEVPLINITYFFFYFQYSWNPLCRPKIIITILQIRYFFDFILLLITSLNSFLVKVTFLLIPWNI